MNSLNKNIFVGVVILLVISISANIYSFNKLNGNSSKDNKQIVEYQKILTEKNIEIAELNEKLMSKKDNKNTQNELVPDDNSTSENTSNIEQELKNSASHFIEYAFNSSPSTYVTKKQHAANYMTDELVQTIFSSDGLDETVQNVETKVNKIKVYVEPGEEDECIVYYNLSLKILSSNYEETSDHYVKLKFKTDKNMIRVSEIEAINITGGI